MRTTSFVAIATTCIFSGCNVPAEVSQPQPQPDIPHMLVTPPERLTVLELREILERLPGHGAPMPAASGEVEVDRIEVAEFYEKLQAEQTAEGRAGLMVEESLDRNAPVEEWTHVREFSSRERCETTKGELQEITKEASDGVSYYHGMPLYELQWVFLEWSNRWAECVPVEDLQAA